MFNNINYNRFSSHYAKAIPIAYLSKKKLIMLEINIKMIVVIFKSF